MFSFLSSNWFTFISFFRILTPYVFFLFSHSCHHLNVSDFSQKIFHPNCRTHCFKCHLSSNNIVHSESLLFLASLKFQKINKIVKLILFNFVSKYLYFCDKDLQSLWVLDSLGKCRFPKAKISGTLLNSKLISQGSQDFVIITFNLNCFPVTYFLSI